MKVAECATFNRYCKLKFYTGRLKNKLFKMASDYQTIANEENEEKFGYVFAVSGPGMYTLQNNS